MSVGPASAWPDQAKATTLPSGDNAGGPSSPGYDASGSNSAGGSTGVGNARHVRNKATPAAIAATPPAIVLPCLRSDTGAGSGGSARTDGGLAWADEAEFASKSGT